MLQLADIFKNFFESRVARTQHEVEAVLRVRYKVYCEEAAYFSPESYADQLEWDIYDDRSLQAMLIYRPAEFVVGAVRLILAPRDTDTLDIFPFQEVCPPERYEDLKIPWETTAEISRFCLTRELAGAIGRTSPQVFQSLAEGDLPTSLEPRQFARCAKVGLIRGVFEMTAQAGVTHWFAVMEPHFLKSLEKLGVHFRYLGGPIDYYGLRQPCVGEVDALVNRIKLERRDVWELATADGRILA